MKCAINKLALPKRELNIKQILHLLIHIIDSILITNELSINANVKKCCKHIYIYLQISINFTDKTIEFNLLNFKTIWNECF